MCLGCAWACSGCAWLVLDAHSQAHPRHTPGAPHAHARHTPGTRQAHARRARHTPGTRQAHYEVRVSRGRQGKKVINFGISAFGPVSVDLTGSMSRKVGVMGKNTRTWWCMSHVREALCIKVILSYPSNNVTRTYPDMVQVCSNEQHLCSGLALGIRLSRFSRWAQVVPDASGYLRGITLED